mmetsp:Transcript_140588/g.356945  ORF Transcript_140588/g.356945 Transcript_140588/m.356945 type:complete len:518 (-) Transcript_140588:100-1653(-)
MAHPVDEGLPLTVKNTFLDFEDEEQEEMRGTKSVPYSFRALAGDKLESFVVRFAEVVEEIEVEDDEGIETEVVRISSDARPPISVDSGSDPRVRAVTFMLPSETSRLAVKNTFINIDDDDGDSSTAGSPNMRPLKSVPVSFKPGSDEPGDLPLSPTMTFQPTGKFSLGSDSPQRNLGEGEGPQEDTEDTEEPALCHLRTVSLGPNPRGPHLGLLWAPDGRTWADISSLASATPSAGLPLTSAATLAPAAVAPPAPAAPTPVAPAPTVAAAVALPDGDTVWEKSQTAQGCRQVQQMLDEAPTDEARMAIALELRGHIWDALRSPHANYVVTKCIATLPAASLKFIVDEIPADIAPQAAKHKFGCRIIQRIVEKCTSEMVNGLVEAILADFTAVARHPYGNYVAQNLLQNGTADQKQRIVKMVETDIRGLTSDSFGCTVVNASLSAKAPKEGQVVIARAMANEPGLLLFAACTRHGHVAASRVLDVLQGQELVNARTMLLDEVQSLRASRFGRNVADKL